VPGPDYESARPRTGTGEADMKPARPLPRRARLVASERVLFPDGMGFTASPRPESEQRGPEPLARRGGLGPGAGF
jgi:hypothetical protein